MAGLAIRNQVANMRGMPMKRAAQATLALAIAGLAVSVTIAWVHARLEAQPAYISFCNVNQSVNCDRVLTSPYAHFAKVPVAWWALASYVLQVALAIAVLRAERATRRRQAATLLFITAAWGAAFSIYLAVVSLGVLRTVCLLCSTLYVVNAGLWISTWVLMGSSRVPRGAGAKVDRSWRSRTRLMITGAATAVALFFIASLWTSGSASPTSADEIQRQYPDVYRQYMSLPITSVNVPGGHTKGTPGGVVIVEFSDFECGHCANAYHSLKRVMARFGGNVQLVFHHFPLDASCNPAVRGTSIHRDACLAAVAAECAGAQDRFWPYHDILFENQSALDRESLITYADRVGLDRARFLACLDSDAARRAVEQDVRAGDQLGITSTPTFFLNGRTLRGTLESDMFENAIVLEQSARRTGS